jgi:hypothetical protein
MASHEDVGRFLTIYPLPKRRLTPHFGEYCNPDIGCAHHDAICRTTTLATIVPRKQLKQYRRRVAARSDAGRRSPRIAALTRPATFLTTAAVEEIAMLTQLCPGNRAGFCHSADM